MTVKVLLVDDHALIREGLRRAFEQTGDLEVIGEAASAAEARALHRRHQPDVAVVDINLGADNGLELVRELRAERPSMALVVLTMYDGDEHLFAAIESGASALVLKSAPVDVVVSTALRAVSSPNSFTADDLGPAMRRRLQAPAPVLTDREQQILELLAGGASVADVSRALFISSSTTKSHVSRLYDKLGAANRAQAVMAAVKQGLLSSR